MINFIYCFVLLVTSLMLLINEQAKLALVLGSVSYIYLFWCLFNLERFLEERKKSQSRYISPNEYYRNIHHKKQSDRQARIKMKPTRQRIKASSAGFNSGVLPAAYLLGPTQNEDSEFYSPTNKITNEDSNITFAPTDYERGIEDIIMNPATGEIMIGGIGGLDTSGNPYGSNDNNWDSGSGISSSFDDSFDAFSNDSLNSFDNSFFSSNDNTA